MQIYSVYQIWKGSKNNQYQRAKSMNINIDTLDTVIIELIWRIRTQIRKLFVCVNAKTQKFTKETIKKCGKLMKAEKFYSRV